MAFYMDGLLVIHWEVSADLRGYWVLNINNEHTKGTGKTVFVRFKDFERGEPREIEGRNVRVVEGVTIDRVNPDAPADGEAQGAPVKTGFIDKTIADEDGTTSPYVVFIPHNYDGKKPFPVILFLHGLGDDKKVGSGLGTLVERHEKSFGFITVFPHAKPNEGWEPWKTSGKRAVGALDEVMKTYKTDVNRVYCTGLSLGGFGTWAMAAKYPDKWAAIVPIAGGGKTEWAAQIKEVPVWAFHGGSDPKIPVQRSREMVEALKNVGASPRYTEYPGVGHNSWDRAYSEKELFRWLREQKKH
jgi:predicted peptidase